MATPVMNFESLLPQPITAPIGSFPVSTGVGQGYVGESALTPITYLDQKSTTVPYYQRMMLDVQQALGSVPKGKDALILVWSNGGNTFRVLHSPEGS